MDVKESLKILRAELDMTQLELANALGVTHRSVSRWELDKAFPQNKMAEAIIGLSKRKGASQRCVACLESALRDRGKKALRVPKSKLYPVDRESICDLVDHSHNAIYVADLETDEILYANAKAEEYAGKTFQPGEKCYHFMHGRNTPCLQCPKAQMLEHESSNYHVVSPESGRHYLFRGRKLKWNGKPAHAQYFFEEATALEEEDGFHKLVDALDMGICTFWVHEDGRIEINYMNDGYFAMVGSSREKRTAYAGYGVMNAVCDEDQAHVRRVTLAAGRAAQSFQMRYRVLLDDGSPKALYLKATFMKREAGKSLYYCTVQSIDSGLQSCASAEPAVPNHS